MSLFPNEDPTATPSTSRKPHLCEACLSIVTSWDEIKIRVPIEASLEVRQYLLWYSEPLQWINSASRGCVICSRLLDNYGEAKLERMRNDLGRGMRFACRLHVYTGNKRPVDAGLFELEEEGEKERISNEADDS